MPRRAWVSSSVTPDGGEPAFAPKVTTKFSRCWNEPNNWNKNAVETATTPKPDAPAMMATSLAAAVRGTMSP